MEINYGSNEIPAAPINAIAGKKEGRFSTTATSKVAKDFEAMFVGMMLKSMRETVGKDKLINGGHGEEVYRSILDQEYAKALTEHGGIGLTAMFEKQMANPGTGSALYKGMNGYDPSIQTTKIEVNHEDI